MTNRFADDDTPTPRASAYPKTWWYAHAIWDGTDGYVHDQRINCTSLSELGHALSDLKRYHGREDGFGILGFEVTVPAKDAKATERCLTDAPADGRTGVTAGLGTIMARFGRDTSVLADADDLPC